MYILIITASCRIMIQSIPLAELRNVSNLLDLEYFCLKMLHVHSQCMGIMHHRLAQKRGIWRFSGWLEPRDLLISRARERERMLPTHRSVHFDAAWLTIGRFTKNSLWICKSSPSCYFVRKQCLGGVAYGA